MDAIAASAQTHLPPPLILEGPEAATWADIADVVVVGYGGAGVCAALHAKELGADVLAIDRFDGGGATAFSGGVYYGGGTRYQAEAGVQDTPEEMFKYLKMETRGVVRDETMERFCRDNNRDLEWLAGHGVPFGARLFSDKTAYPPDDYELYWCGNERVERYAEVAKPAPRGHRTRGSGYTGRIFYAELRQSADRLGVRVLPHAPARRPLARPAGFDGLRRLGHPAWTGSGRRGRSDG